jgi:hypothetical protein
MSSTAATAQEFTSTLDSVGDWVRALNEKLIATAKRNANTTLDAYEMAFGTLLGFQQQVAHATQLEWVSNAVKAQAEFATEISSACTSATRKALK